MVKAALIRRWRRVGQRRRRGPEPWGSTSRGANAAYPRHDTRRRWGQRSRIQPTRKDLQQPRGGAAQEAAVQAATTQNGSAAQASKIHPTTAYSRGGRLPPRREATPMQKIPAEYAPWSPDRRKAAERRAGRRARPSIPKWSKFC